MSRTFSVDGLKGQVVANTNDVPSTVQAARRTRGALALLLCILAVGYAGLAFATGTCSVDGSGNYISPINTDTAHGFGSPATLLRHTITGSSCLVNATVRTA